MKVMVVYYSMDGNSKYVADEIANQMDADVLRIEPVKSYPSGAFSKRFWGGKDAIFGGRPELKPYYFKPEEYDVIIIGTPNWTGTFAAPMKTFLDENDLDEKKVAFYVCSASGNSKKCFGKLKIKLPNSKVLAQLSLTEPKNKVKEEDKIKIQDFCNQISMGIKK